MWEKFKAWVQAEIQAALHRYHQEYHSSTPAGAAKAAELGDAAAAAHEDLASTAPAGFTAAAVTKK